MRQLHLDLLGLVARDAGGGSFSANARQGEVEVPVTQQLVGAVCPDQVRGCIGVQAWEARVGDPDDGRRRKRCIPASASDFRRKFFQRVRAALRRAAGMEGVEKPLAGNVAIAFAAHVVIQVESGRAQVV